jgi:tetratricopeptide (TPR) repeat protein
MPQIWPEGFVHEGNLTQTIYLLRKSLAADPAVLIENVPRRGYRLQVTEQSPSGKRLGIKVPVVAAATVFAALVCIGIWILVDPARGAHLPLFAREDAALAVYHFDRFENLDLARAHFDRLTKEAPGAPEGYAGLALIDAMNGFESPRRARYCGQGKAAVARANAAGESPLGHIAGAMLFITCDRSLPQARRELDTAIAMNPSDAMALTLRSRVAFWENRPLEAVSFASRAVAADPTSPEALLALGLAYYFNGDFAGARDTFGRLLELVPNRAAALKFLERTYEGLHDLTRADDALRVAQRDPSNASWVRPTQARLLALTGHSSEALAVLQHASPASDPESLAAAYAALSYDRAAIEQLKIAASRHSLGTQVAWLDDFRFAALRRKFPELTPTFVTWR